MNGYNILDSSYFKNINDKSILEIIDLCSYREELIFNSNSWSDYLKNYLVLTHKPSLLHNESLDELTLLVNRYYWFKKFYSAYTKVNGIDVGI